MAGVNVQIACDSAEQAAELAAALREAGTLNYQKVEGGDTVNLTVGDVTVES
jgi:hypothetical protein